MHLDHVQLVPQCLTFDCSRILPVASPSRLLITLILISSACGIGGSPSENAAPTARTAVPTVLASNLPTPLPNGTRGNPWTPESLRAELLRKIGLSAVDDYEARLDLSLAYAGQYMVATGKVRSLFLKADVFYSTHHWRLGGSYDPSIKDLPRNEVPRGAVLGSRGPPTLTDSTFPEWTVACNHMAPRVVLDDLMKYRRLAGIIRFALLEGPYADVGSAAERRSGASLAVLFEDNCYIPEFNPVRKFEERRIQSIRGLGISAEDEKNREKEQRRRSCRDELQALNLKILDVVIAFSNPTPERSHRDDMVTNAMQFRLDMGQECNRSFSPEAYNNPPRYGISEADRGRQLVRDRAEDWANGIA